MTSDRAPLIIADRYKVIRQLGAGGYGRVFACEDLKIGGTLVAVKLFPPHLSRDKVACARIQRELRAAFRVNHDNVVRFYEPIREGDIFGYAMELVEGGPLCSATAETSGKNAKERYVLEIMCQVCSGLSAIHREGLVHRDLKPENVMLSKDGFVKISDFGLAKPIQSALAALPVDLSTLPEGSPSQLTMMGDVVGTAEYISPEYLRTGKCDARADIYAAGVIAYELVTGRLPYKEKDLRTLMHRKMEEDVKPPYRINPYCPPKLSEMICLALNRNPALRYYSADAMHQDLILITKEHDQLLGRRAAELRKAGNRRSGLLPNFLRIRLQRGGDYIWFLWKRFSQQDACVFIGKQLGMILKPACLRFFPKIECFCKPKDFPLAVLMFLLMGCALAYPLGVQIKSPAELFWLIKNYLVDAFYTLTAVLLHLWGAI